MADSNKTYIGVVEDNNDPKKMGRVKIRVMDIFDETLIEDIPWASPFKDLNGNSFNVPDKGKVLMVVFDQGNEDLPEFIYADHYNINLEKKLEALSGSNYTSMKSVLFDNKTQIYVNDNEGLKIDHKYNNLNITENSIDLNLKDNNRNVNIGDANATQQAILGNNWMDWFDEFVDNLLGSKGGPFLGNLMSPVIANPSMIDCLLRYKALRDPVFLSHHVNIVDNNKISTVSSSNRVDDSQIGDAWVSTKDDNNMTTKTNEDFRPVEGPKKDFDEQKIISGTNSQSVEPLSSIKSNPTINKLIRFISSKNYKYYDDIGILNIIALRTKYDGIITNKFDDTLYVFYRKINGNWELNEYSITSTPGFIPLVGNLEGELKLSQGVNILTLGQYIDQCELVTLPTDESQKCLIFKNCVVHKNDRVDLYNYKSKTETIQSSLYIHRASAIGSVESVYNYSNDGSQVFKSITQYNQFINLVENQNKIKSSFTYTICNKNDFDDFD